MSQSMFTNIILNKSSLKPTYTSYNIQQKKQEQELCAGQKVEKKKNNNKKALQYFHRNTRP